MKFAPTFFIVLGLITTVPARAIEPTQKQTIARQSPATDSPIARPTDRAHLSVRGWDYVLEKLATYGVQPDMAARVLSDLRMPERQPLLFSLTPRESRHIYRKHNTPKNRANALRFYRVNENEFQKAARTYRVDPSVILAILQVETHCGQNTGKSRVLPGLARLAAAGSPENIASNIETQRAANNTVVKTKIIKRARWLEDTFMPHVAATFAVANSLGVDTLDVKGSASGAYGLPQFLPGNVLQYGVDANLDGKVDIYNSADAIHSVAKFLRGKGWDDAKKMSVADKRAVIWEYNRSAPYIDTVLSMANALSPHTRSFTPKPVQQKLAPLASNSLPRPRR